MKHKDQQEIDDVLAQFLQDELSLEEAEEAVKRLHEAGAGVIPRLLSWLDGPDTEYHTAAAILLAATGDAKLVSMLMDRIRDPSLDDLLKVKLIAVVGQLDPSADSDDLFDHLQDSASALQQAREEHLQLLRSPYDLAVWLENIQAEDPTLRLYLVENSIYLNDPAAVPMLICLCYDSDDEVALAAMDGVERFKDIRALRALEELADRHPSRAVRTEAQKTADRLRVRAPLSEQQRLLPVDAVYACYLTPIDAAGGQVAFIVRRHVDGSLTTVSVMFDDQEGIKDCFGADMDADELVEMLEDYTAEGILAVRVSHEACLSVLDMAIETSWSTGRLLPMSFLVWRELIESGRPDEPVTLTLPRVPAEQRDDSLAHCYELLYQDEFQFWLFHPEEIEDLRARYVDQVKTTGAALDREAVETLLRGGVREVVGDRWRRLIQGRLQRMVPLLYELYEEEEVWQWAAVAAEALADDSPIPVQEHPFLIGMLACSLEEAIGGPIGWFDVQ